LKRFGPTSHGRVVQNRVGDNGRPCYCCRLLIGRRRLSIPFFDPLQQFFGLFGNHQGISVIGATQCSHDGAVRGIVGCHGGERSKSLLVAIVVVGVTVTLLLLLLLLLLFFFQHLHKIQQIQGPLRAQGRGLHRAPGPRGQEGVETGGARSHLRPARFFVQSFHEGQDGFGVVRSGSVRGGATTPGLQTNVKAIGVGVNDIGLVVVDGGTLFVAVVVGVVMLMMTSLGALVVMFLVLLLVGVCRRYRRRT